MFCFNISMVSVLFKIGSLFKCLLDFLIFAYSIVFFFFGTHALIALKNS